MSLDIIELRASKHKDPQKQIEEESASLLQKLEKIRGQVWVLDETGRSMTSPVFSSELQKLTDIGEPVTFVLGGAYGLTEAVRERADTILRLSDMVLPHELCRVVFLEQLYRAGQIEKGSEYHH